MKFRKLSPLGICEYALSSLYIYTDRNPFSKDSERLKANKRTSLYCCYHTNNSVCMAWIQSFACQSPSQFNLEFSQISLNLYVKMTFVFVDGNLSLEVSDQIGETLEVNATLQICQTAKPFRCRAREAAFVYLPNCTNNTQNPS